MSFCSRAAQGSALPPGSAVHGRAYVLLPVHKTHWGAAEFNSHWASPADLEAIREARREGVITRLFHPPSAPAEDAGSVLVFRATEASAPPALDALLGALTHAWKVRLDPGPRLLLCTQGTRDRCCAKWGFATFREAQRLHAEGRIPFAPLESSHLGGDRFAATGVFFPTGAMHAWLDGADLATLAAAEAAGELRPEGYRGRVFDPPLLQVVRAGLARDGVQTAAAAPLTLLDPTPAGAGAVRVALPDGRGFAVAIEVAETTFYSSCSALHRGRTSRGRRLVYAGARLL